MIEAPTPAPAGSLPGNRAAEATRLSDRTYSLLTAIHPVLERVLDPGSPTPQF